ncbi:MAG: type II toxin-antitoxin system VapC family toxin [Thermoanaerobaculia bacterium]
MKPAFLDTGYLIALEAADDENHQAALRHWQSEAGASLPLVTTTYVISEVVTFFNNRGRHAKAVEIGHRLLASPSVRIVHVDQALFFRAWRYFREHSDKTYSFTDCVSFVLMRTLELGTALAFDRHFVQAGFRKLP